MTEYSPEEALVRLRADLWRYISMTAQFSNTRAVVASLTGLSVEEADALLETRLGLSPLAERMLHQADATERTLPANAQKTRVDLLDEVEGDIDWPTTVQRRLDRGEPTLFSCVPTRRHFETARARLLASCLRHFEEMTASAVGTEGTAARELVARHGRARRLRSRVKLRDVRPLSNWSEESLARFHGRRGLDACVAYAEWVRDGLEGRDLAAVREVVEDGLLHPASPATLFEYEVGFNVVRALEAHGLVLEALQAHMGSAAPFARLVGASGTVMVWRQRALATIPGYDGPSAYAMIRSANGLRSAQLKPDWVIEVSDNLIPIEVKLYGDPRAGVARGIVDTLACLADRRDLLTAGQIPVAMVAVWQCDVVPTASGRLVTVAEHQLHDVLTQLITPEGVINAQVNSRDAWCI